MSPLQNITIKQIEEAAERFASEYVPMYRKVARQVFIEAIVYAQKIDRKEVKLS